MLYACLDRWIKGTPGFIYVQLVGDALVVTAFVRITGGLDSPMSFLYLLPIAVAALLLVRRGGLVLAGVCFALYAGLVLHDAGWVGPGGIAALPRADHDVARIVFPDRPRGGLRVGRAAGVALVRARACSDPRARRSSARGRRLQALNENIIESIHSGVITTDLQGRVNFMNRGGAEITGRAQDDVEGTTIEDLFGMEAGFLAAAREPARGPPPVSLRARTTSIRTARGSSWVSRSPTCRTAPGSPLGYIFTFQDLTEVHAVESQMRLKERMEALGQMAAGMAHELRNPLAAISGSVQYLKGDLKPGGETLELMDIILRESQRLDHTIRDFLTFARPGKFSTQRCDLVRLLEDHLKLLRKSREFTGAHRVETRFAAGRCGATWTRTA